MEPKPDRMLAGMSSEHRLIMLDWLQAQQGCLYRWGGKGELSVMTDGQMRAVYDCSGLVTSAFFHVGARDLRQSHNAQRLWDELEPIAADEEVLPLDLALYGSEHINHVMFVWGDGRVMGACGGDHTTVTIARALEQHAKVQFRPVVDYRHDIHGVSEFRGYRRTPLL